MARRPWVRDRQTALYLGVGCYLLGSLLLWDVYENRGNRRPFAMKLLPGG